MADIKFQNLPAGTLLERAKLLGAIAQRNPGTYVTVEAEFLTDLCDFCRCAEKLSGRRCVLERGHGGPHIGE